MGSSNPNNGRGVFSQNSTLNQGNIPNIWPADINGDGKPDMVLANFRDGTVTVLKNTTGFAPPTIIPTLSIKAQGNDVHVAWPSMSPGWSLQQKADLCAANWLPSGYGDRRIVDDGVEKNLTLPFSAGNLFFRLIHP